MGLLKRTVITLLVATLVWEEPGVNDETCIRPDRSAPEPVVKVTTTGEDMTLPLISRTA